MAGEFVQLDPPTIELDLVHPVVADWRRGTQFGLGGDDELHAETGTYGRGTLVRRAKHWGSALAKKYTIPTDASRDPYYLAVGRCLEKWAWVETNLALLMMGLMRHRRGNLVGAAFHSAVSFRAKLKMVDAIAQQTLAGQWLQNWDKLRDRIRRRSEKRNQIAHFHLMGHGKPTAPLEMRLHPYWSITRNLPAPKNEGLTAEQLHQRADLFTELSFEVLEFCPSKAIAAAVQRRSINT